MFTTVVPFGARTLDRSNFENRYLPVVRTRGWIASSIERGLAFAALADDADPLWSQITTSVSAFLHGLWLQGALFGTTPVHAYFVHCDATTNSAADIAAHRVNVLYGAAYLTPDEFYLDELSAQTFDGARTPNIPALQAHNFGGNLQLAFPTEAGFDYTLESSVDLAAAPWLGVLTITGDGAWHSAVAPIMPGDFFQRLRIAPTGGGHVAGNSTEGDPSPLIGSNRSRRWAWWNATSGRAGGSITQVWDDRGRSSLPICQRARSSRSTCSAINTKYSPRGWWRWRRSRWGRRRCRRRCRRTRWCRRARSCG